jgi:thiamine-phosphate pyrophosphorylase
MIRQDIDYTLYLATDRRWLGERTLWDSVEEAIRGGVTLVQLREKEISSREYLELARRVKEITDHYGIPLIINDRIDIALAIDADGVHVGPEDLPVPIARQVMGKGKIIGTSAVSVDEALLFQAQGADYLGVGAVFPTATKQGTEKVGLDQAGPTENLTPMAGSGRNGYRRRVLGKKAWRRSTDRTGKSRDGKAQGPFRTEGKGPDFVCSLYK